MLNLLEVIAGQSVRLRNGTVAEVLDNLGDGIWLVLKIPVEDTFEEELVHCEEIIDIAGHADG